jgi:hypothetical protein
MRDEKIDPNIKNVLNELQHIPRRDPTAAVRGKVNFMKQASMMRTAVSRKQESRHIGWINTLFPAFPRLERTPMFNTLVAVVLALAVFFGGTGVTVYAAQESLPDQTLYPVKTGSEDVLLALTGSPQARLNYILDFSDRRINEMAGLLFAGDPIPERVVTRLQNELQQALELAVGMDDSKMVQELEQLRLRAETQLQMMNALVSGAPVSARPVLLQAHARIQEQVQLCALGQADPQEFKQQMQQRRMNQGGSGGQAPGAGNGQQIATGTPMPGGTGAQRPGIPTTSGTPVPFGTNNGPGKGGNQPVGTAGQYSSGSQSPDCTPQSGSGSGHKP